MVIALSQWVNEKLKLLVNIVRERDNVNWYCNTLHGEHYIIHNEQRLKLKSGSQVIYSNTTEP